MGQMGANATKAENDSIVGIVLRETSPKVTSLQVRDAAVQCGPGVPCVDGSCCNSVSISLRCGDNMLTMDDRKENVDSRHIIA